MKKLIAILVVMLTMISYMTFAQEAEEQNAEGDTANTATANTETEAQAQEEEDNPIDYKQTLIDFTLIDPAQDETLAIAFGSDLALTLPEEEFAELPPINYGLENWRLMPGSSIRINEVYTSSRIQAVNVQAGQYEGLHVLGVKIKFPPYNYDMYVSIVPPFTPDTNNEAFLNNGVLDNVGVVKSAYLTAYGLYQPEKIYLITEDDDGTQYQYAFGSLDFIGWRTLEWINSDYIDDVRDRESDHRPLYPRAASKRKFKSILIQRSALNGTTDFVTYIKDVAITYDKAINTDLFNDIANEETWNIIADSVNKRENIQLRRSLTARYFEYLEDRKKYSKAEITGSSPSATDDTGGQ